MTEERSVVALVLIQRACSGKVPDNQFFKFQDQTEGPQRVQINNKSVHRLMLVAIIVAQKFFNDKFYGNNTFSKIGGVSIPELNLLEQHFLGLLDFDNNVSSEQYEAALDWVWNRGRKYERDLSELQDTLRRKLERKE